MSQIQVNLSNLHYLLVVFHQRDMYQILIKLKETGNLPNCSVFTSHKISNKVKLRHFHNIQSNMINRSIVIQRHKAIHIQDDTKLLQKI